MSLLSTFVDARGDTRYLKDILTADTTVTVKTSGGDYTTIADAMAAYARTYIPIDVTLTIEVDDGTWAVTGSGITDLMTSVTRVIITGKNTYAKTMSSVQSSSGSSGAWSIVINLNNVTNVASGDWVTIMSASGGTTPSYIVGCHQITNVDSGNNRITLDSKNKTATAPSGAVACTVTVFKTIISTTGIGHTSNGGRGLAWLDKMVLVNNGGTTGLYSVWGGRIFIQDIGVSGFTFGVYSVAQSPIFVNGSCAVSNCTYGFIGQNSGFISANGAGKAVASGCTNGVYMSPKSDGFFNNIYSVGNTTGVYAAKKSYVTVVSSTLASNTTDTNPTVNTVGNEESYIDT